MQTLRTIFLELNEDGEFDIVTKNGQIKTNPIIDGVMQHILFCDGRAPSSLQPTRERRRGHKSDIYNNTTCLSILWTYTDQNYINNETLLLIRQSLLIAFNREEVKKLYKNIDLNIIRTEFNSISINIIIDTLEKTFII